MKKNRMMRVASALLVAVLLTTCAISGTFAKYVSTSNGSDSARVAKWDIKLEEAAMTETFTFDLFNTVKDTAGAAEADVKVGDGETIIAPGTSGSFEINLKNDSEVNAKYAIAYTVTNANNIPVQFKVGDGEWTSDLTTLNASDIAINMGASAAVTVEWKWVYENNADAADTTLGKAGTATITVAADVTVTQVD